MGHSNLPTLSVFSLLLAALSSSTAFAAAGPADPRLIVILEAQPAAGIIATVPDIDVDPAVGLVTGYFPAPGTNNILSGTGRFANATGRVRLSGAAKDFGDGTANLNCLFVIDLD